MDRLPQELIDQISKNLSHADLKQTLLLSKSFRFAAEKYSGAFGTFKLHESNGERFIDLYSGHRLRYLRKIEFAPILPQVDYKFETRDGPDQLRQNDESFTRQIRFFFTTFKTVEDLAGSQYVPGKVELKLHAPSRSVSQEYMPIENHFFLSWRVHLLEAELLPILESISSLEFTERDWGKMPYSAGGSGYYSTTMKLDYRAMVDIAVKLPNLDYWGCRVGGGEWMPKWESEAARHIIRDWPGPRKDSRLDFAKALHSAKLSSSLRRIRLDFLYDLDRATWFDHLTEQPDLVAPATYDPFSVSLHVLSQNLRRIHLRVVADESLFWPKDKCIASWPNLEFFFIVFHIVAPSGQWYFVGPRGEGHDTPAYQVMRDSYPPLEADDYDDEMQGDLHDYGHRWENSCGDSMRIVPNDSTLRPFLAAFARATARMGCLKEAALWCPLLWSREDDDYDNEWLPSGGADNMSLAWGIHYLACGERDWDLRGGPRSEISQLWWKVSKWRPDPELHELFQKIGSKSDGSRILEHWTDSVYGDTLVDRCTVFDEEGIEGPLDDMGEIPPPN